MRKALIAAPVLVLAGACMHPSLRNTPDQYVPPAPLITSDANKITLLGMYPEPLRMSYALYNCPDGRIVVGPLGWKTSSCAASRNVAPASAPSLSREPSSSTPPQPRVQTPIAPPAVRPVQTRPGAAAAGAARSPIAAPRSLSRRAPAYDGSCADRSLYSEAVSSGLPCMVRRTESLLRW